MTVASIKKYFYNEQAPFLLEKEVNDLLTNKPLFLSEIKELVKQKLGEIYYSKKTEPIWVMNYKFDTDDKSVTNFLASYITLRDDISNSTEDVPTITYRAKNSENKSCLIELTFSHMKMIYKIIREKQIGDYATYQLQKEKLNKINSLDELVSFLDNESIPINSLYNSYTF